MGTICFKWVGQINNLFNIGRTNKQCLFAWEGKNKSFGLGWDKQPFDMGGKKTKKFFMVRYR